MICDANDSPLRFSHSLPKPALSPQIGGLSLTKRSLNAWICACSTEDSDLRTRVSSSDTWFNKVRTPARPASTAFRLCSIASTAVCKACNGTLLCFPNSRVAAQVLANRSRPTSSSSRLVACCVSSFASADRLSLKSCQVSLIRYKRSRDGLVLRSFVSSASRGSISPVRFERRVRMASVLD